MPLPIKPIKPKRISDQVFDQLRELIFRGQFKAGEKIITEREMATAFGVSRTSVRDAINKLVIMGILEQRQGQGTFVRSPESRKQSLLASMVESQNASLIDVLEVRLGLECNAAALAAVRAQEKDLQFMEKSIEELEHEIEAGRLSTEADVSFHMAIAYATQNRLQVLMMKNVYDYLFTEVRVDMADLYTDPAEMRTVPEQHREIYRAIQAGDPETAHRAMKQHIECVDQMIADKALDP
ncbi:HTH-type transcriptional regulator LutR [Desulfosarcina cetonica]|uniref:FadR/GntR family transcriptional regulator n=1 Tax=Desulfosarcina cetonica TaxID=90730 RepID=UPI0006D1C35E|nr:FadR/GntR family transcriptional regulator [Desulfosarcina cetonica]VTR70312.1 HTH-type transcriptional regulator LutR [Desulfosarcina cetonica]